MTGDPPLVSAPAGAPVARYVLKREHHVRALLRASAGANRRVRLRYAAYAAVMAAAWLGLHAVNPRSSTGGLLLYGAVVFAGAAAVRPLLIRWQAERMVSGRSDVGHDVEARVAGGAFVLDVAGVFRLEQRVATLHAVHVGSEGVLVEPFPNEALLVPAEGFATPADRAAFEQALLAGARLPDAGL